MAVDASMAMYQFLIATQMVYGSRVTELKDRNGNLTGHLMGIFHRTILFMEHGIKPIWVFDGKPPMLKADELEKRKQSKKYAEVERKKAERAMDFKRAKQMANSDNLGITSRVLLPNAANAAR